MDENDIERVLGRMVRVGTVTAVDIPARRARVKFHDDGMASGMLYVLAIWLFASSALAEFSSSACR